MKTKKVKLEKTLKQRAKDFAISNRKAATKRGTKVYMTVEGPKGPKQVDLAKYIANIEQKAYIKGATEERVFLQSLQEQITNRLKY